VLGYSLAPGEGPIIQQPDGVNVIMNVKGKLSTLDILF
jgi:hypothetical protein